MSPSRILAHRGLWSRAELKNSRDALRLALSRGFGLETDVRDLNGELVISHDLPRVGVLSLRTFLEDYRRLNAQGAVAFNIKSDGLAADLVNVLQAFDFDRYFVFDMSVPDMTRYRRLGVPFFSRRSELESEAIAFDECAGIWLDAFTTDWYKPDTIAEMLAAGKQVAVVSPELHGRDHQSVWHMLQRIEDPGRQLLCCTDYPEELQKWMS
jgi:glycerophosphoryl diester phosphodiesterase